jgi:alpha-1,6-mannosyltransferase
VEQTVRNGERPGRLVLLAAPPVAAHLGLLLIFDLSHHPVSTLALSAAAFLGLAFAARRLEAAAHPGTVILLGACLIRLCLLPLPPTLSDDVLRYLWDGKAAASGRNPYALAPDAPQLAPLRDAIGRLPPHADIPTVYPPLAITAFSIATMLPFPLLGWKILATAADLGGCVLLLRLARRRGLPPGRVAWYAWNPLVALEVAGMGHVDALGVVAVIGAVLALTPRPEDGRRSPVQGALWAAAGVLAKLAPLALLPLWCRRSGRPAVFLAVALGLVAAAVLPVLAATGGIPPGLIRYGISWEFNGPLYEPLWRLLAAAGAARFLQAILGRIEMLTGIYQGLDGLYPYLYPQLIAKALLGAGMLAAVAASLRETDLVVGTGRLLGRLLLLSATVYPWYLLWVLPWAALERRVPWLVLSALIPLVYLPHRVGTPLVPWVFLLVWAPFWGAFIRFREK